MLLSSMPCRHNKILDTDDNKTLTMDFNSLFADTDALFLDWGMAPTMLRAATTSLFLFAGAISCIILFFLLLWPISGIVNHIVRKSRTRLDDIFLSPSIVRAFCLMLVAFYVNWLLPQLLVRYPQADIMTRRICHVIVIASITYILCLEIKVFTRYMCHGQKRSGFLIIRNVLNSVVISVAALLSVSTLMGREIAYILSALGAMAAVLMLVFKDSILGLIAGIRLSINDMLKANDWVTVPSFNADGRVEDVSLTTVKIRNWDKSISTVPPHALLTDGFINHESMLDLGVRQIRRTIAIDVHSIRRLTTSEIDDLGIAGECKTLDLTRPQVNLTLLRHTLRTRLAAHPRRAVDAKGHKMQLHVRELPAEANGIPVEIFMFVQCPDWEEFELLQGDIYDDICAEVNRYGLRLFQHPSGADLRLHPAFTDA